MLLLFISELVKGIAPFCCGIVNWGIGLLLFGMKVDIVGVLFVEGIVGVIKEVIF